MVGTIAIAAVLALAAGGEEVGRSDVAPTRERIEILLDDQTAAWNRGDLEVFCSAYADDALFLTPTGSTRGRQAVLERYRRKYPDTRAMGNLAIEPLEVREAPGGGELEATMVSVAARWTLTYPDKPAASGLTLIVFERRGERWVIVQDASM